MNGTRWNVYRAGDPAMRYPTLAVKATRKLAEEDARQRSLDGGTYIAERDNDHSIYWVAQFRGGRQVRRRN
jgi:hypothetical protein